MNSRRIFKTGKVVRRKYTADGQQITLAPPDQKAPEVEETVEKVEEAPVKKVEKVEEGTSAGTTPAAKKEEPAKKPVAKNTTNKKSPVKKASTKKS